MPLSKDAEILWGDKNKEVKGGIWLIWPEETLTHLAAGYLGNSIRELPTGPACASSKT